MTIVLEHQFWDLEVDDQHFAVTLSFANRPERISIPLMSITAFADPSVNFGLKFEVAVEQPAEPAALPTQIPAPKPGEPVRPAAAVVTLDKFRKR